MCTQHPILTEKHRIVDIFADVLIVFMSIWGAVCTLMRKKNELK